MNRSLFISQREARWGALEKLVSRASRRRSGLSTNQLIELGKLYRATAVDLALALKYFPDDRTTIYLNSLVRRSHSVVYMSRPSSGSGVLDFVRFGFPESYRRIGAYTAASFGICLVSAVLAAVAVITHQSNADLLLGHSQASQLRGIMSQHHLWMGQNTADHSVAANFIMLNNIRVAFLAFVGGIAVGLGTIAVMVENGIMIGAIGAMVAEYGLSRQFWTFVLPHGVLEMSVIFMAGGAGLVFGDALLRPGLRPRGKALVDAARTAALIILGCIPLLMIAGTIEGFYSASNSPAFLKVAVGLVSGTLLYTYLLTSRRSTRSAPS